IVDVHARCGAGDDAPDHHGARRGLERPLPLPIALRVRADRHDGRVSGRAHGADATGGSLGLVSLAGETCSVKTPPAPRMVATAWKPGNFITAPMTSQPRSRM